MKTTEVGDDEPEPLIIAPAACNLECYQGLGKSIKMLELASKDFLDDYSSGPPTDKQQILYAMRGAHKPRRWMLIPWKSRAVRSAWLNIWTS